jgi:hypothetical protein
VSRVAEARAREFPEGSLVVARRFAFDPERTSIDDNETVPPGTLGTVTGRPDDFGSVPVRWRNGSTISFLLEDEVELVAEDETP